MYKCKYCGKEHQTKQSNGSHEGQCNWNKNYHFIYKTTNKINNHFYIGMHSTNNIDDGYLGSGKRLYKEIKKHGKEVVDKIVSRHIKSKFKRNHPFRIKI